MKDPVEIKKRSLQIPRSSGEQLSVGPKSNYQLGSSTLSTVSLQPKTGNLFVTCNYASLKKGTLVGFVPVFPDNCHIIILLVCLSPYENDF